MNAQQASQIKPGTYVRLSQDRTKLAAACIEKLAGMNIQVYLQDPGNNRLRFKITPEQASQAGCASYDVPQLVAGEWYAHYDSIDYVVPGKHGKPAKFGKKDVEAIAFGAGQEKLKSSLTERVQQARRELETAAKSDLFNTQMKKVAEQLRQAKLIRSYIKN